MRAGILDEPDEIDLVSEIRRDPHLTEEQKQTLVRIYESFRNENDVAASGQDPERNLPPLRSVEPVQCARSPSSRCTRRRSPSRASATAAA